MRYPEIARLLRKNQTDVEKILWSRIRSRQLLGIKFRRQQPIEGYIVDFISFEARIIIELDGGQHSNEKLRLADQLRDEYLKKDGYLVIRFWNSEILNNIDGVIEALTLTLSRPGERG